MIVCTFLIKSEPTNDPTCLRDEDFTNIQCGRVLHYGGNLLQHTTANIYNAVRNTVR